MKSVFVDKHGIDPAFLVGRDGVDDLFEEWAGESFLLVDLSHFFAFAFGAVFDVARFDGSILFEGLNVGAGFEVSADGHAESVGDDVGESEDEGDACSEVSPGDTGYDGEGGDGAVDGAEDKVAEFSGLGLVGKSVRDGFAVVFVFYGRGMHKVISSIATAETSGFSDSMYSFNTLSNWAVAMGL